MGAVNGTSPRRALLGIVGDFSDPTNERIIYLSAAGLALVGVALLLGTIVWWRRGRQEHPALAPLEVMGRRAWAKAPAGERRRRLDHVRSAGAGATANELARADPLDLEALVRSTPQAFDDLREPGESVAEVPGHVEEPAAVAVAQPDLEDEADADVPVEAAEPANAGDTLAWAPPPTGEPTAVAPLPAPVAADPDATSVSTERPAQTVDALASGPQDPMS